MLREIVRPKDRHLKIDIPQEYIDQEIEILVLPLFEVDSSSKEEDNGYDEELMRLFENAPNVKVSGKRKH